MKHNVAILGCGWLGIILARKLIDEGFMVRGSTTRRERIIELEENGISGFEIDLKNASVADITRFIADADSIVVAVPPKGNEHYPVWMGNIAAAADGKQIVFTSSTSVYGKAAGIVTEDSQVIQSPLSDAEKAFPNAVILRLGGLMGYQRHPVFHLAGRQNIPDPDAPINLIHADDVVEAILQCLARNIKARTINIVAPWHPSRKEYYQSQSLKYGLPMPEFMKMGADGKTVESLQVESILGFLPNPELLK